MNARVNLTRMRIRKNPYPRQVASELGISLATVYRHIEGMDLQLIQGLNELPPIKRNKAMREMAGLYPQEFQKWYGVSDTYISNLINGK